MAYTPFKIDLIGCFSGRKPSENGAYDDISHLHKLKVKHVWANDDFLLRSPWRYSGSVYASRAEITPRQGLYIAKTDNVIGI